MDPEPARVAESVAVSAAITSARLVAPEYVLLQRARDCILNALAVIEKRHPMTSYTADMIDRTMAALNVHFDYPKDDRDYGFEHGEPM